MTVLEGIAAATLAAGTTLLCKRDDETSALYGGNKVRKLERILEDAIAHDLRRLVTVGAVGSHHVVATTVFGRRNGFEVEAILTPQPWSEHVEEIARVGASLGLVAHPVQTLARVPIEVARLARGRDTMFIPPGGSSVKGALGYADAADELAESIARGELARPDAIVVALGSGGTAAGLIAGLARHGLLKGSDAASGIEVVAAQVVDPPLTSAAATLALTIGVWRALGERTTPRALRMLSRGFRVSRAHLGEGYGHATEAGASATELAKLDGLTVDATYTAKTLATAIDEAKRRGPGSTVLYWHTLAAPAPFARLVASSPPIDALDPRVRALMLGAP